MALGLLQVLGMAGYAGPSPTEAATSVTFALKTDQMI